MQNTCVYYTIFITIIFCVLGFHPANAQKIFYFSRPKLAADLSYEATREIRKGKNINSTDTINDYTEHLNIETKGWVYHPALFDFKLGLSPEWTQTFEDHTIGTISASNNIKSYFMGYYFDASVFQFKPYTLQFFARKQDNDITGSFASKSDSLATTYGTNLVLKYRTLPTIIGYVHNSINQTGFYSSIDVEDEFKLDMRLPKENNKSSLNISFIDKTQNTNGFFSNVKTLDSDLNNIWEFSKDQRRSLISYLQYRETKGTLFNNSTITFNQNFFWEQTEELDFNGQAYYSNTKYGEFNSETMTITAGLNYDIFDNLQANLTGEASAREYQGGSEQIYSSGMGLDYQKSTPLGEFRLISNNNYRIRFRNVSDGLIQTLNEPHTLNTTQLVFLNEKYIDPGSIIVTNAASSIRYIENIDYIITQVTPFVRIRRVPLGAIADGENVLVSYQFDNPSNYDDATLSQSYGITYIPIEPLSISYLYNRYEQFYKGGVPPDYLDKDVIQTGDIAWDVKWSRTRLFYQNTNSESGTSNSRWTAEQAISYRYSRSVFTMLSAIYGVSKFKDINENETFYLLRSQVDYAPSRSWKISLEGYRNGISGDSIDTLDHGFSAEVDMFYGIWSTSIKYIFIYEKDGASSQSRQLNSIYFRVSRSLW
ncbi:MAG: hypothetical protein L3J69_04290 [Desulfobacula sp.]|nr:hypothetical protein [Desulfobacula sp.]